MAGRSGGPVRGPVRKARSRFGGPIGERFGTDPLERSYSPKQNSWPGQYMGRSVSGRGSIREGQYPGGQYPGGSVSGRGSIGKVSIGKVRAAEGSNFRAVIPGGGIDPSCQTKGHLGKNKENEVRRRRTTHYTVHSGGYSATR